MQERPPEKWEKCLSPPLRLSPCVRGIKVVGSEGVAECHIARLEHLGVEEDDFATRTCLRCQGVGHRLQRRPERGNIFLLNGKFTHRLDLYSVTVCPKT